MIIRGYITHIGQSGFMVKHKSKSIFVPYENCPFCVDDSVVVKGHIYNSRILLKDFTYKEVLIMDCTKVCVK